MTRSHSMTKEVTILSHAMTRSRSMTKEVTEWLANDNEQLSFITNY